LVAICPSLVMMKPVPAACPLSNTTLMLTTPGRALLMRSETSDLASTLTACVDAPTDVVSKPLWWSAGRPWARLVAGQRTTDGAGRNRQDGDCGERQATSAVSIGSGVVGGAAMSTTVSSRQARATSAAQWLRPNRVR
jgi:hypothetical protein